MTDAPTAERIEFIGTAVREVVLDALRRLQAERGEDGEDGVDEFTDDEYDAIAIAALTADSAAGVSVLSQDAEEK